MIKSNLLGISKKFAMSEEIGFLFPAWLKYVVGFPYELQYLESGEKLEIQSGQYGNW